MREGRVVAGALLLGHVHDLGTEVGGEPLADGTAARTGGESEHDAGQPLEVEVGAGERHGGVQGDGQRALLGGGRQHAGAVPAAGVHHHLAGAQRSGGGELLDEVCQRVVGHGEQQQVGCARDGDGRLRGEVGKQRAEPHPGGARRPGRRYDVVAGGTQGGGEDGTDAAGADDADAVRRGIARGHGHCTAPFVPVPCGVPDGWG